jgi:hypothetical protein
VSGRIWLTAVFGLALGVSASAPFGCGSGSSADPPADAGSEQTPTPPTPPSPPTGDEDASLAPSGPQRLSETGLYADLASRTLAPGVLRFTPAHPLWADGAQKERFILLPPGAKIDTSDMDAWVFPVGTKLWKAFRVDGKLVETRFLWKRGSSPGSDSWWKAAYVWEADGSDAIVKPDGVPSASGTTHDVPSQTDCVYCHENVRDVAIGFSAFELSSPRAGATDGGVDEAGAPPEGTGLLLSLAAQGIFTTPPNADFAVPGSGGVRDVLAYFHGNCGFCHKKDGKLQDQSALRLRLLTTDTTPEVTGAYTTPIHLKMRHVMPPDIDEGVVPGQPERSQLYLRMISDTVRMPPKGTKVVDPYGSGLVRDWILALPP